ncbi:threonine transporter [Acinetobacter lactucae]|uniref:LysE family translocator n=1 Tax=Acinetobacter calcoaceticus/baumannii complex TaxID=909768 RepID=UPI0009BEC2A1|nr:MULTISPECIES: LysE family translocator [Acinetobacter calcoaceticus/baumannii complex]ARD28375.1 threonine transporter [Acinetobacter lactucae]QXA08422.1 LysE family translocator [Acinetobacter pittii]
MENLTAFSLFAIVASITPGPTNFLILSLSSHHKISKTLPVIFGSCIGASLLVLVVGVGLGTTILAYPLIQKIMTWSGLIWLTLLAWKLYNYNPVISLKPNEEQPSIGFIAAFLMQAINPKTWMMAFAVISVYTEHGQDIILNVSILSFIFLLVAFPCLYIWALIGSLSNRLLSKPKHVNMFNKLMALMLLISIWWPILSIS